MEIIPHDHLLSAATGTARGWLDTSALGGGLQVEATLPAERPPALISHRTSCAGTSGVSFALILRARSKRQHLTSR